MKDGIWQKDLRIIIGLRQNFMRLGLMNLGFLLISWKDFKYKLLIIIMLNLNTNLLGMLLSHDGWSGDTATGRRRVTSQGWRCYIGNIDNMSDLIYYFDSRKGNVTETNVKEAFKQLLYNKTNDALTLQGQEIFDVIWGKTVLRGNLFQGINFNDPDALNEGKRQFISKIKDTSNSFYNFINVR
jgi:hypothetical protein